MAVGFGIASSLLGANTDPLAALVLASNNASDTLFAALINKGPTNTISPPDGTWTELCQGWIDTSVTNGDFQYAVFWKFATASGGGTFNFTKATDDNNLFAGVIWTHTGVSRAGGTPIDAAGYIATPTTAANANVSFAAYDPVGTQSEIFYLAFYGDDTTTFSAAMSADTNPDCTLRFDRENNAGTDASIAGTSGPTTDGSLIAARTWASGAGVAGGSVGVVFGIKSAAEYPSTSIPVIMNQYRQRAA